MKWLDIDSAPRDMTMILLCDNSEPVYVIEVGEWSPKWQDWRGTSARFPFSTATHWMPLPPPPERKG